jgi:hypothetical protein
VLDGCEEAFLGNDEEEDCCEPELSNNDGIFLPLFMLLLLLFLPELSKVPVLLLTILNCV